MSHSKFLGLEKVQIQLTTAVAMAAVYFGAWQLVQPADPQAPLTFLAGAGVASLAHLSLVTVTLAAALALVTTTARVEAVLMAVLLGVGAAALRSQPFTSLLWYQQDHLSVLYAQLITETFTLAGLALAAGAVVVAVRTLVASLRPAWLWRSPLDDPQRKMTAFTLAAGGLVDHFRPSRKAQGKDSQLKPAEQFRRSLFGLVLGLVVSGILFLLLMRSDDRGQVIFAVGVAFFGGAIIAHQIFQAPMGLLVWVMPLALAAGFYIQGMTTSVGTAPQAWMNVPLYARVLPIDWIAFGMGGAYLGYWISHRLGEMKHLENAAEA